MIYAMKFHNAAISGFSLNTAAWLCRKGYLCTNVLAIARHDKTFSYIWVGASGCCSDTTVINALKEELDALLQGL